MIDPHDERIKHLYKVLAHVKDERERLNEMDADAREELLELIGDDYTGIFADENGQVLFKRETTNSRRIDTKALRKAHPELAEKFTRASSGYKLQIGES